MINLDARLESNIKDKIDNFLSESLMPNDIREVDINQLKKLAELNF